jgi:hypothetical protein
MATVSTFKIPLELSEDQAEALAQLCKRFGYSHAVELSNAFDGGRERDDMIDAVCVLRRALRDKGFAPR